MLLGLGSTAGLASLHARPAASADPPLRFALTPVLLTSDLVMLEELKAYLARAMDRPVHLVTRRTYQEITALVVSRQVEAAWICGYPFVAFRSELALVAVPVWRGKPLYQSYLICRSDLNAQTLSDLAGTVHAFSDPDSNSGYLVTCAALVEMGTSPTKFFRQFFYTYGHRNVVRAVSAGLAASGSVDGYVYDVLRETEPELVARTRVIRKSELLGFPPIACAAGESASPIISRLRTALVDMPSNADGKRVLGMLRLDGFSVEQPELFDAIAAKMKLVRGAAE
jgi:phosphonate transport system substrate-binding protein